MARGKSAGWISRKAGRTLYRYYDASGAEHAKVLGTDTMSDRDAWRRVGELGLDKLVGKPRTHQHTLTELAAAYLNYGKTKTGREKAPSTRELDAQLVRDYVDPKFGSRVAKELEPIEIQEYIDGISEGLRPKVRTIMSAIYRHAQKYSMLPRTEDANPMKWVSASTITTYEACVMTPGQAWQLAENLPLFERTLAITEAATGCRISECLALKWSDIEWKKQQIKIKRGWVRGKIGKPKSKASAAPVPLHPALAAVLDVWRKETMYGKDDDWVFPSIKLGGRQPRTASTMVADYVRPTAEKLGIITRDTPRFGWHNFRHSLATFLIGEGQNPDVVRRMLRQSHLDTTLIYTHMDSARIEAQGRMLEQMNPAMAVQ